MNNFVNKGDRVQIEYFACSPTSLSGMQMKFGASLIQATGVIKHIRGNDPVNPTQFSIFVDTDQPTSGKLIDLKCNCGHTHLEIKPEWIKSVIK